MDLQNLKQRFDVIGNSPGLNRALDIARQVAPTDLSVLVTGESGTGKEIFPQIIHQYSARKHGRYIAVNCGAIPEGTIDSELFGHEKGSFTGAHDTRKGYFEVADEGTIFLDEAAELPLSTQVRLLRVLESGEFMKVGSSKMQKTNVRIIAATNINPAQAVQQGKFREDLYYRLNTVPITVPPLRERREDIYLLFRKFASDFAQKYRMPPIALNPQARTTLENYYWPGNVRQLKNVTEQISVIEQERDISSEILGRYLTAIPANLPVLYSKTQEEQNFSSERDLLYKILFDLRSDVNELKKWMYGVSGLVGMQERSITRIPDYNPVNTVDISERREQHDPEIEVKESMTLQDQEIESIRKMLKKYNNKRKSAARALGISERTLYRKIKDYDIQDE